jgi:competence protein ComEA
LVVVWLVWVTASPPANAVLIVTGEDQQTQNSSPMGSSEPAGRPTPAPTTPHAQAEETAPAAPHVEATPTPATLAAYVSGAVLRPGVYQLPVGSRVADAVQAAGGPQPDADLERINLAARVADEDHIVVPRMGEAPVVPAQTSAEQGNNRAHPTAPPTPIRHPAPTPGTNKVNINTAPAGELETLPGVGPALAQRIVQYRQVHGPFATVDDLKRVRGIGNLTFERIKHLITVGP